MVVADVEALHGRGHGRDHLGVAVAQVVGAAVEVGVDQALAVDVVDVVALTPVDDQRHAGVLPELGLVRVPELLGLAPACPAWRRMRSVPRSPRPPSPFACAATISARSAQPNMYLADRLLSSGRVARRLTQPELLIMVPTGCYAPRKCAGGVPMGHAHVPESSRVASAAQPAEDYDVSQRQDVAKLRKGAIGLGGVLFLTVTGAAPISAMLFKRPDRRGLRSGRRRPGRVHVRHDRARGVLGRVRRNGEEEDHGGRLLLLHQPRARPGARHRHRVRRRWSPTRCSRRRWPAASPTSSA